MAPPRTPAESVAQADPSLAHVGAAPRLFAVVSWGCAATSWLAKALDTHPDVRCSHLANYYAHRITGEPRLDGPDYLRILAVEAAHYPLAGDVHGITAQGARDAQALWPDAFQAVAVTRHPIERLASHLAHTARTRDLPHSAAEPAHWPALLQGEPDLAADPEAPSQALGALGLPTSAYGDDPARVLAFAQHAAMLGSITDERTLGPVFRCEDLTQSPGALACLLDTLAQGTLKGVDAWAEAAVKARPVNQHRDQPQRNLDWPAWTLDVLRTVVPADAWAAYRSLAYELPRGLFLTSEAVPGAEVIPGAGAIPGAGGERVAA